MRDTLSKIQHRVLDLGDAVRRVRHSCYNWSLPGGFYTGVDDRVAPNWRRFGVQGGWVT